MTVGDRIKELRGKESRPSFCPKLGISKSTLVNYETGVSSPTADVLNIICDRFQVNPAWLLRGEGPMRGEKATAGTTPARAFYAQLVGAMERILEKRGLKKMGPERREAVFDALCDLAEEEPEKNPEETLASDKAQRILRLVS